MKTFGRVIKRLFAGAMTVMMCMGFFTGAAAPDEETKLILGEMIYLTAKNEAAAALVNNSGMSGLESSVHLSGTDTADMYTFNGSEPVILSLPRAEMLGQFYIWNYNDPANLNCGVKELNIQYSVDGVTWSNAGNVTLPQANGDEDASLGGCVACNFDTPFDFGGVPAKYIALTAMSNHGGASTGLSEVRVFRHKTRPGVDGMIYGEVINITAGTTPEAAFNNQGMSDLTSASATHNNNPADMWLCTDGIDKSYAPVNLDGTYPVSSVTIWNYNDPADLGSGIKEFEIYYTVQAPCAINTETVTQGEKTVAIDQTFDFSRGDWRKVEIDGTSVFTIPQGTGEENMKASLTITFDEVIEAQHMKIVPVSNYGGSGYGLSEVRFFAGKGWGIEPSRKWTGVLSSSGSFAYQGGNENFRDGNGWIYADGVYSYHMTGAQSQGSLTDDSVIFFSFEDTCIGNMKNYKNWSSYGGYTNAAFNGWTNDSFLVIKGDEPDVRNAQFILYGQDSDINPLNNIFAKQYWTGDFTLINGDLYVHAPDISDQDSGVPVDMVRIRFNDDLTPNMTVVPEIVAENIPGFADGTVYENTVEAGAPNPDGYIYVFTKKSKGNYRVCRVLPENYATNFDKYEFWGGEDKGWVVGDESVTKVIGANVSTYSSGAEAAIAYMPTGYFAGNYVNIYTEGSIGGQLRMGISDSLVGKFAGIYEEDGKQNNFPMYLFWAPEKYKLTLYRGYDAFDQWNYNAKSHPAISEEGELIISYHIGAQRSTGDRMGMEYTHPVFYNLFSIGNFDSVPSWLLYAAIGGGAVVVIAIVAVAIAAASKKKGKKAASVAAKSVSVETAPVEDVTVDAPAEEATDSEARE